MKPVKQTIFDSSLGDCFRACVASIFEFSISEMPNFWEQTQDCDVYWRMTNEWLSEVKGFKCILVEMEDNHKFFLSGLVCVAIGKKVKGGEDHAVVWRDRLIHDPHLTKTGLMGEPSTFAIFSPIDPMT